jgi:CDP-glucose 4,6-dehydratase
MSFWRARRVFLTGHTGFKGAWLSLWLNTLGAKVTGYSLAAETDPNLYSEIGLMNSMDSIIGDIRDLPLLEKAIARAKPEVVIHLAAQALVRKSYTDPVYTYATNVLGTVNLLDAIRRVSPQTTAVVIVTSDKCYENREWDRGYKETDPMGGYDPYSSSKGCAELVTSSFRNSFFKNNGTRVASARAGNVIGGGDWSEDRLIPDLMKSCLAGTEASIRNPHAIRPWQHVLESCAGYLKLVERLSSDDGEKFAEAWNFGPDDGGAETVEQVVKKIAQRWDGLRWKHESGKSVHEARLLKLDSEKSKQHLGWKPRLTLDECLEWTVDWYKSFQSHRAAIRSKSLAQIENYSSRLNGV